MSKKLQDLSDGYHTFQDMYDERAVLFLSLCKLIKENSYMSHRLFLWKSRKESIGRKIEGYFLVGITNSDGSMISYHLENKWWDKTSDFLELQEAPQYDWDDSYSSLQLLEEWFGV